MIVPLAPEGVSLLVNMGLARQKKWSASIADEVSLWLWFYNRVRNGGPWDYKQKGKQFEKSGSFHYGAVGAAAGFSEFVLHRAAGAAQFRAQTTKANTTLIDWFFYSYGDDETDQEMIAQGIKYAKSRPW
jgi:hypothetical protein